MRIHIEFGGLDRASEACRTANQISALVCESLAGKLAGFAGMAGDDSTSVEFASTYDDSARHALRTMAELTHAFIGVGRVLAATAANHRDAEAASAAVSMYTGTVLHDDDYVRVSPAMPPSSLGSSSPTLGVVDAFIIDHVEGFVWPGADVELLLDAGTAWRRAGSSVAALDEHCAIAVRLLERQTSPEVPLALEAFAELRSVVADTADALLALGTACAEYAAAVRDTHERTLALLAEIGQMIVEGIVMSAVIGAITGGVGAGAAGTAALARITAQAPRFHALLMTLRVAGTATASRVRAAREALTFANTRATKFARFARNERGSVRLPGGLPRRIVFSTQQVQRKFKHAPAFGISGPYNPTNARRFEHAIQEFMESPGVITKTGTMRGQTGSVVFHYDATTRKLVATTRDGDFISGWVLNARQLAGVMEKGHLGAG